VADLPQRDAVPAAETPPAAPATARLPLLRLLRPRQWTKNLLLFAALVFAKQLFVPEAALLAALAFVTFCAASSSVYVVNDWLDAERDRVHPEKRFRPIAAGHVSSGTALAMASGLTAGALLLGFWIHVGFGLAVVLYLALSHFYSSAGKNVPVLDVMLIAAGFVMRAWAGALAIQVPTSAWFVLCTLFAALFIALSKRKSELLALREGADGHRPVLAHYTEAALNLMTSSSIAAALITYALYVVNEADAQKIVLATTFPFVLFGIFRYALLVETSGLGDRPEEVLLRDRPIQVCVLGFAVVAAVAYYLPGAPA